MTNLISAEAYKFVRSKSLYISLAGVLLLVAGVIAGDIYDFVVYGETGMYGQYGVFTPTALDILLVLWFPVFVSYFAGMDFQNKTVNDALCLGKSRLSVYLTKLAAVFAGTAVMTLFAAVTATIAQSAAFGFGNMTIAEYVPYFLLNIGIQIVFLCARVSVFAMIAFVVQTPVMTLALSIGYIILSMVVQQAVQVLFGGQLAFVREWFPGYYQTAFAMQGLYGGEPAPLLRGIVISVVWITATSFVGYNIFNKKDLK